MELDCGLEANDAIGYALTREHYGESYTIAKTPSIIGERSCVTA